MLSNDRPNWAGIRYNFVSLNYLKTCRYSIQIQTLTQECIPVGCVLVASVATTRCQYWGSPFLTETPLSQTASFTETPFTETPRRNMGPGTDSLQKEHGTRQSDRKWYHTETPPWTEWLTDRCKNIAFPQLRWRAVTTIRSQIYLPKEADFRILLVGAYSHKIWL